jgi:hypothetical protein
MGGSLNESFDIVRSMRIHWVVRAFACALIATLPATLAAQAPAPEPASPSEKTATTDDNLAAWGLYARLAGKTVKDVNPRGYRLTWHWETPGEVLLEDWFLDSDVDKPSFVMTIRLGPQPGTLTLKSSAMMGKEWAGTVQEDGSVSYVGKGLLKMPYTIHIDDQGNYEAVAKAHTYRYLATTSSETPVAVAETSPVPAPVQAPVPAPVVATAPPAPATLERPAPVVAKQEPSPPPPPVKAPRKLSEADLARLQQSVQKSRARSFEQARQIQLQQQEAARQAELQAQVWAAQEAQRQAEEAAADAEFEAERARKAAAWQQQSQASEQALANSIQRLNDTTARVQAQQAEAQARQRAQADALAAAERQRQMELVRQANQRQNEEAARLAAQREQYEQQRADAEAAERARQQQQRGAQAPTNAGRASTDTDANRCVTQSEVRQNDTFKGNTAAYVVNGCGSPVDVKVCLMTESGWKCGATWGLASQARWSYSALHATGPVFVDAKTAGSSRPMASPN